MLAIVDFVGSPPGWGDGYRVDAYFEVWRADEVLTVPIAALFREGQTWQVYVAEGGRAVLRPVDIGWLGEARAQVLSGLNAGARVVLYPDDAIRDGDRLHPMFGDAGQDRGAGS